MSEPLAALWFALAEALFGIAAPPSEPVPAIQAGIASPANVPSSLQTQEPVAVPVPMPKPEAATLAPADQPAVSSPVACHLGFDGPIVVAAVTAAVPQAGSFTLDLAARGANTARTRQSGAFVLAAGETVELAAVRLGGSHSTVSATLDLAWSGGATSCSLQ